MCEELLDKHLEALPKKCVHRGSVFKERQLDGVERNDLNAFIKDMKKAHPKESWKQYDQETLKIDEEAEK